jgi:hypothetical protein
MSIAPTLLVTATLLGVAMAAGCARSSASTPRNEPAPRAEPVRVQTQTVDAIRVTVIHNLSDAGALAIFVEPEGGTRTSVGSANPGETQTFTFRVQNNLRRVRLVGLRASGTEIISPAITVPQGSGVGWDVQLNSVRLR